MIDTILKELGLSEKEILVYLAIVKHSFLSSTQLAKQTKLHRPTVYDITEKLLQKGLITQIIRAKKKSFQPTDFNKFISKLKEQETLAYLAATELKKINLPSKLDYEIEIFEGKEGFKSYFDFIESLLKQKKLKEFLVLGSKLESTQKAKYYFLSRIKNSFLLTKNIDYRTIWNPQVKKTKMAKLVTQTGKHKYLPKKYPSDCTTVVFNSYVALVFNTDKPIAIRIHNKKVAQTYRNQFNLVWDLLQ